MIVSQNVTGSEITIIAAPAAMCARVRCLEGDLTIKTANAATTITIAKEVTESGMFMSVWILDLESPNADL